MPSQGGIDFRRHRLAQIHSPRPARSIREIGFQSQRNIELLNISLHTCYFVRTVSRNESIFNFRARSNLPKRKYNPKKSYFKRAALIISQFLVIKCSYGGITRKLLHFIIKVTPLKACFFQKQQGMETITKLIQPINMFWGKVAEKFLIV